MFSCCYVTLVVKGHKILKTNIKLNLYMNYIITICFILLQVCKRIFPICQLDRAPNKLILILGKFGKLVLPKKYVIWKFMVIWNIFHKTVKLTNFSADFK